MKRTIQFERNSPIVNRYLHYLIEIKNYSELTVYEYYLDLNYFFQFIIEYNELNISTRKINIFIIASIKREDIIAFLIYLNYEQRLSAASRRRKLASIRSFYKWVCKYYRHGQILQINPAKDIENIRKVEKIPKHLNKEECNKILNIFSQENSKSHARNNTIIALFIFTGIRLSELVGLNIEDCNFTDKKATIKGKGNKERTIFFNQFVLDLLLDYLASEKRTEGALFLNLNGERLSYRSVEEIVKKAFSLANLEEKKYTVHTLRHSFATLLYQNGVDIRALQELLGHESIVTTQIYTRTHNEQIRNAVESNPLANYTIEKGGEKGEKNISVCTG